ncbi:MAG TPA: ABC transporter permease [Chthoniobacterales bacterium]|jgi:phospholipid/cholesterol/gamma-HCH transport system permease protein|nr:ABC transporter permease [Chthoniobacterales bacterium]
MITDKISYSRLVVELLRSTFITVLRPSSTAIDSAIAQMRSIGLGALPTAGLIAVAAGFILALVLEIQLSQIGKVEIVPSLLWVILSEQVVPVGVALIFAGRSVSAVTAELGSMQVSEEIKALFTMGIDVVPYLLVPRFLGFQIMLPVVTLVGVYASLLGGWLLCGIVLRMGIADYIYYAFDGASFWSVMVALAKSALFAFLVATIAFYKGLNVRNGSREISEATTQSVVWAVTVVTMADAVVTSFQLV